MLLLRCVAEMLWGWVHCWHPGAWCLEQVRLLLLLLCFAVKAEHKPSTCVL
jgi:hypothetical protein